MGRVIVIAFIAVLSAVAAAHGQMGPPTLLSPGMLPSTGLDGGQSGTPVAVKGYVGWLEHGQGNAFSWDYSEENLQYVDRFPLSGVWVGAQAQVGLTDRVGVAASGGILIPSLKSGVEKEDVNGLAFPFEVSEVTWGYLEAAGTYGWSSGLQLVGGVRWDKFSYEANFENATDFLHVKVNAYIPFFGLEVGEKYGSNGLTVRAIGWPGPLCGEMKYNYVWTDGQVWEYTAEVSSEGLFFELFAEYSRNLPGAGSAALFAKWTFLDVKTGEGSYRWREAFGPGSNAMKLGNTRKAWVLGGSLTYDVGFSSGSPNWDMLRDIF